MKLSKKFLLFSNVVLLASVIFFLCIDLKEDYSKEGKIVRDDSANYPFTSPILDYEDLVSSDSPIIPVGVVNKEIDHLKKNYNNISHISFYYRDLNNGQWIGVNEKEEFSPASLLKVPVLFGLLKTAENNPVMLEKKIVLNRKNYQNGLTQNIVFDNNLEDGKEYSLLEIAKSMIVKSDNVSANILVDLVDEKYIKGIFESIGVPYLNTRDEIAVRVKDYAAFFRVLYNASYLNREMSELALSILSESEYNNGLRAGVPSDIKIAHKFGERALVGVLPTGGSDVQEVQLHDCGIVYYPKKPYIICIMTRGQDFSQQENAIAELSKFIYEKVDE